MIKITGEVIKGKNKGKILGFPTVNIALEDMLESGVYAGKARTKDGNYVAAVFINQEGTLLEAHILGFSGDLYGKKIEIEIGKKIRKTKKFGNDDELIEQIKKDIVEVVKSNS